MHRNRAANAQPGEGAARYSRRVRCNAVEAIVAAAPALHMKSGDVVRLRNVLCEEEFRVSKP